MIENDLHTAEEANRRLKDIVRLTSDIVWEADRDFLITAISGTVLKHTGFLPNDIVGLVATEFWNLPDPDTIKSLKPFRNIRSVLTTSEGGQRWFLLSGLPVFDKAGNFQCVRGLAKEISDQVRMEQRLYQN